MVADQTNGPPARANGRFQVGNPGGPGNPHARAVGRLRSAMLGAVTDEDIKAICARLVAMAREGNVAAAREVLDRCLGKGLDPEKIQEPPASYRASGPF